MTKQNADRARWAISYLRSAVNTQLSSSLANMTSPYEAWQSIKTRAEGTGSHLQMHFGFTNLIKMRYEHSKDVEAFITNMKRTFHASKNLW